METTNSTPENCTDPNSNTTPTTQTPDLSGLTKFQTSILAVLADDARYGLAIKRELEDYSGQEVNHGRLYPNLDTLVQKGLVEKSELDKRTNEYAITPAGRAGIEADVDWIRERVNGGGN